MIEIIVFSSCVEEEMLPSDAILNENEAFGGYVE